MMSRCNFFQIGIDDTDSSDGMCTTFLIYSAVKRLLLLQKKGETSFLDYPHLIRLNPNIPWKTRGNAALSLQIKTTLSRERVFEFFKRIVVEFATSPRANSGLVLHEGQSVPEEMEEFSRRALYSVMSLREARKIVHEYGMDSFEMRLGQGLVGALSSIGNRLRYDHTFELIAYRKDLAKKRSIDHERIVKMSESTFPETFSSYDQEYGRVMILPHGPDPVLCGIRGETPIGVLRAFRYLLPMENLGGYMIFRSNQGTGEHLAETLDLGNPIPYSSGRVFGTVASNPTVEAGGHLFFRVRNSDGEISCACYEPTADFRKAAAGLTVGDIVEVAGGIRKPTSLHSKTLNLESIRPLKLQRISELSNPKCPECRIGLKSKGRYQGYVCEKCGYSNGTSKKNETIKKREISLHLYIPPTKAQRHLTKPLQRYTMGLKKFRLPAKLVKGWIS